MAKNIAIFTTTYLPTQGGIQYLMYWFLKEIDKNYKYYKERFKFDNFYFIAPNLSNNESASFSNIKTIEITNTKSKLNKIKCIGQIIKIVIKYDIHLIHTQNAYFESLCCNIAKKFTKIKYIITSHGEDLAYIKEFNYGSDNSTNFKRIVQNNIKNSEYITTISTDMCQYARELTVDEKVVFIPNPSPFKEKLFQDDLIKQEINILKERYNIDDKNIICLTLSGAREIKGHDNMILAFKKAYKENNTLRLFITAHGGRLETLKALVKKHHLDHVIYFTGFITGITKEAFFRLSNIYVNTAYFEPFGLVYLESIEHALVNLGSIKGGGKDIFTHLENAYLVDPYAISEIEKGFIYLTNVANRNNLINSSRKILDNYKIEKIMEEYFKIYSKVI